MSVIYRPRHHPYIPNGPTPALIQASTDANDFAARLESIRYFQPTRKRVRPFTQDFGALLEAEDNDDELIPWGNKWKLFGPQTRVRADRTYFPFPGGEDPLPPVVSTKALRHTQGRGPKTKLFTMRLGFRHGPSTR
jgi:hypothetical protein